MGLQWDRCISIHDERAHDVRRALSSKWAGYIFHARDFIGSFWEPNTITHRESGLSYFSPIHAYPAQLSTAGSQSGHRTVYHAEPRGPPCREHTEGGPRSKKCTRIPSTLYQHSGLPDERGFGVGVPHCRRP